MTIFVPFSESGRLLFNNFIVCKKKTIDTITEFVMVLLVLMEIELVLLVIGHLLFVAN